MKICVFGAGAIGGYMGAKLAQAGAEVSLVDSHAERLAAVQRIWGELKLPARFVHHTDWTRLPFADDSFDLAWNWAALWYLTENRSQGVDEPSSLLRELVRVSKRVIFVAMPNRVQLGYLARKYLL